MSNYFYIETQPGLFTVGTESRNGEFLPDSDHSIREEAAQRVHELNGGNSCIRACGPSDFYLEGKCGRVGCYHKRGGKNVG